MLNWFPPLAILWSRCVRPLKPKPLDGCTGKLLIGATPAVRNCTGAGGNGSFGAAFGISVPDAAV